MQADLLEAAGLASPEDEYGQPQYPHSLGHTDLEEDNEGPGNRRFQQPTGQHQSGSRASEGSPRALAYAYSGTVTLTEKGTQKLLGFCWHS